MLSVPSDSNALPSHQPSSLSCRVRALSPFFRKLRPHSNKFEDWQTTLRKSPAAKRHIALSRRVTQTKATKHPRQKPCGTQSGIPVNVDGFEVQLCGRCLRRLRRVEPWGRPESAWQRPEMPRLCYGGSIDSPTMATQHPHHAHTHHESTNSTPEQPN